VDVERLGQMLARIRGKIRHVTLDHLSPFSVAVIAEIGRQRAPGEGAGEMTLESAEALIAEASA
jgi:ATP-dependent Lhr-like helicase